MNEKACRSRARSEHHGARDAKSSVRPSLPLALPRIDREIAGKFVESGDSTGHKPLGRNS